eukprot:gene6757-8380_t
MSNIIKKRSKKENNNNIIVTAAAATSSESKKISSNNTKIKTKASSSTLLVSSSNVGDKNHEPNSESPHSPSLERFSAMSKPRESLLTIPETTSDVRWGTFNYIAICYVMAGFSMMADNYITKGSIVDVLSGGSGLQLCVYSLKNHSYWHTNYFLTKGVTKANSKNSPITRRDLTPNDKIRDFIYFIFAPTLVFETSFPKTRSIRWGYILKEAAAGFGAFFLFYIVLCRTSPIYREIGKSPLILLLVELSLPSMSLWMLGFYGVFHCLLNIFAEFTMFADREFYQDWWNATTLDVWWRKWNRPVHKWMLRHVYRDSMHTVKMSKLGAQVSTFLLSAVLHELIMIISFRFVRPILSITMLLQIGLVYFTQIPMFEKTRFGNVIMWITVFVGQPLVQLLYSTQYNSVAWSQIINS